MTGDDNAEMWQAIKTLQKQVSDLATAISNTEAAKAALLGEAHRQNQLMMRNIALLSAIASCFSGTNFIGHLFKLWGQ